MTTIDKQMFYNYLDKATVYFEYGSGGSTYQAYIRENIIKIYSVESEKEWFDKLNALVQSNKTVYIFNEMCSNSNNWGYPGEKSTAGQRASYSNQIINLSDEDQKKIDFILIDGRFRVACCLICFGVINPDCLIAFDDFLNRNFYHIVLNYYDVVEQTQDKCMVILKKKCDIASVPEDVIRQYIEDPR